MKILILATLFFLGCANQNISTAKSDKKETPASRSLSAHESHFPHPHKHKTNCGHDSETMGFDTVYKHDGHKHKLHGAHVDEAQ